MRTRLVVLLLIVTAVFASRWGWRYWREHRFDDAIRAAAHRYDLDPGLIKAVIWHESRFDPDARGRVGELGLMQVREAAAQEWAKAEHLTTFQHVDCLNPVTNILAGTWYLKKVLKRYPRTDAPVAYALADYNAGRVNLLKWKYGAAETNSAAFIRQIEFPTTRRYILEITARAREYHEWFVKHPHR
jgi:soluble lytic murein transglycosylase